MMQTRSILFLLLWQIGYQSICQMPDMSEFILEGQINSASGTVRLYPLSNKDYYVDTTSYQTQVVNGHFILKGRIPYPQAYELTDESSYNLIVHNGTRLSENCMQYTNQAGNARHH